MSMMAQVEVFDSPEEVAQAAARWLAARVNAAVAQRKHAELALAGGTTPGRAYALFGQDPGVPWDRVRLYFSDERCVSPDDPESNYRMARAALSQSGRVPPETLVRMQGELPDREAAARAYAALLPPAFDVVVLGIGEDGHTASLFPGSEALDEAARRVVAVRSPKPPAWRLTLTPLVLSQARALLVLATGSGKSAAVARALAPEGEVQKTPARLAAKAGATWMLDRAAAPG